MSVLIGGGVCCREGALLSLDRAYYVPPGVPEARTPLCGGDLRRSSIGEIACADGDIGPGEFQLELSPPGRSFGDLVDRFRAYYCGDD
jgi:hypothetical protein